MKIKQRNDSMKRQLSIAVLIALVLTELVLGVDAQRKTDESQLTKEEIVTSQYDRFEDRTLVSVRVLVSSERRIYLVLFDGGKGKRFVSKSVGVSFINTADGMWKFTPQKMLYLIVDGERVEVPFTGSGSGTAQGSIEIAALDKLLRARKLEGKIADLEFNISVGQMKLLREFRSLLVTE